MKIVIRMDDITPDMDWEKFYRFKSILDRHCLKPLIGVVPDNRDAQLALGEKEEDFWSNIKEWQTQGWVVAMHGLYHQYTTPKGGQFPLNHFSEFAGLSFEKQLQMIQKGKEILNSHGIETDIFMAPAHSFDHNTLNALVQCGFKKITDGFGPAPYIRAGILFMPIAKVIRKALESNREGITTWVFHTNMMNDKDFEQAERWMETYAHKLNNYDAMFAYNASRQARLARGIEFLTASLKRMAVRILTMVRR